jgi:hypothetical protein
MNKVSLFVSALFYCGLLLLAPAMIYAQQTGSEKKIINRERTVATDPAVTVTIDAQQDDIKVYGWEFNEVKAVTALRTILELRRPDKTEANVPATGLQVLADRLEGAVSVYVPRGATVKIQLGRGNVSVENVANVHIVAKFGNIFLRRISKSVNAATPTLGDISIKDATGMINLRTQSGTIKLSDVRPDNKDDSVILNATSGNFELERVSHTRIEAETTSGNITWIGPAPKGTNCNLKTVTGNLTLRLPKDASFQVVITVGEHGRVFTEFPPEALKKVIYPGSKRFTGKYGEGESVFYLASFNGQVRLGLKLKIKNCNSPC